MTASERIQFVKRIREVLDSVFGDRLRGIVLFGSEARGQAAFDSDLDLLVILKGPISLGRDLETIITTLYPIQLEVERPIHVQPVAEEDYNRAEYLVYRDAKREGIAA